jgi:hypothetical protein
MKMGQNTQRPKAEWQESAGLTLPSPAEREWIAKTRDAARQLLEVLVLEESGIRDGDSKWHGSNPVGSLLAQLAEHGEQWSAMIAADGRARKTERDRAAWANAVADRELESCAESVD